MVVVSGLDRYRPDFRRTAVAIGNFDGVHPGHRRILSRLNREARSQGLRSLVLTFFPHPERVLGKKETLMIQTLSQRLGSFKSQGIDTVVVTPFDEKFSALPADVFARTVLRETLKAAVIVVGRNFRFGKSREGDVPLLRRLGLRLGLSVRVVAPETVSGKAVSSSTIRALLRRGSVREAAGFLGRPYEIEGQVIRGRARGKALGFPTANLRTDNEILPDGVFITRTVVSAAPRPSLTSIGTNPTFHDGPLSVETHVLDFGKNLYGRTLTVQFLEKIRNTRAFESPSALEVRMARDLAAARAFFGGGVS